MCRDMGYASVVEKGWKDPTETTSYQITKGIERNLEANECLFSLRSSNLKVSLNKSAIATD